MLAHAGRQKYMELDRLIYRTNTYSLLGLAAFAMSLFAGCGSGGTSGTTPSFSGVPSAPGGPGSAPAGPTNATGPTNSTATPAAGATPTPAVSSGSTVTSGPTPAATLAPLAAGISSTNYASVVNGQPWPATFRPYAAHAWNAPLPATPTVDAANTTNLRSYMNDAVDHIAGDWRNDYSHPVYVASAGDPLVTAACGSAQYGCDTDQAANVGSLPAFHVPAQARPAGGTDAHFAVVQPDGTEYDFWGAQQPAGNWTNGATLSMSIGLQTSIEGSGVPTYVSATSGAALAAGLIRFDELARGSIPHAVFLDFPCTQGVEYPGTTSGVTCGGAGVPMGALVYLNMSDAQIDALPASTIAPYLRPILHALHQYGGYAEDTYGGSNTGAPFWEYESFTQYSAFGQPYPGTAFANANGYSQYLNPTYAEYAGGPIRWSQLAPYVEVLSTCYAHGSC